MFFLRRSIINRNLLTTYNICWTRRDSEKVEAPTKMQPFFGTTLGAFATPWKFLKLRYVLLIFWRWCRFHSKLFVVVLFGGSYWFRIATSVKKDPTDSEWLAFMSVHINSLCIQGWMVYTLLSVLSGRSHHLSSSIFHIFSRPDSTNQHLKRATQWNQPPVEKILPWPR